MVSTRGGARTRAEDPKKSMLAQKPRRATGKSPQRAKAATTKARTTRSRTEPEVDLETEPENELQNWDTEDELQEQPELKPTRTTTRSTRTAKAAVPARKAPPKQTRRVAKDVNEDTEGEASKVATEPGSSTAAANKPAGTARATTTKSRKAKLSVDDKPKLAPPVGSKGTRATRATRATAAKEKAAPLSPKKITQVSKSAPRTARTVATKPSIAKQAASKPAPRGRPGVRRNVSDENADDRVTRKIKEHKLDEEGSLEEPNDVHKAEVEMEREEVDEADEEDEIPASTRPATPVSDSYEHPVRDDVSESESESHDDESSNASGDELCGPKTPMKRCSPRETTRYPSGQKSARGTEVSLTTPVRRPATRGSAKAVTQAQRPYNKASVHLGDVEPAPATGARLPGRSMVFPRLPRLHETRLNISSDVEEKVENNPSEKGAASDEAMDSYRDNEESSSIIDDSVLGNGQQSPDLEINKNSGNEEQSVNESDDAPTHASDEMEAEVSEQSDETTIHNSIEPVKREPESMSTDEEDDAFDTHSEALEDAVMDQSQAPTPIVETETLRWENIREDVTIPFRFDGDLTATALPQVEHNDRLSIIPAIHNDVSGTTTPETTTSEAEMKQRLSLCSGRPSFDVDVTVNISDFIDVNSLSDSRTSVNAEQGDAQIVADAVADDIQAGDERNGSTPAGATSLEEDLSLQSRGRSIPGYALPTIASRSKSLPASPFRTPLKDHARPKTSDGFSMPRFAYTTRPVCPQSPSRPSSLAKRRPSTAFGMARSAKRGRSRTPATRTPWAKTPSTSVPETKRLFKMQNTPVCRTLFASTPGTSVPSLAAHLSRTSPHHGFIDENPVANEAIRTMKERFPGLPPSETYEDFIRTPSVEPSSATRTPLAKKSTKKERFPGLPSRDTYEELNELPNVAANAEIVEATPSSVQGERYPGLSHRRTYEEHARTAMPASRFQTPPRISSVRRPATAHKPTSLRKIALKASQTPMKTPLKHAAETPGLEAMTPHPAAPLRSVVALAEVYTSDGSCATPAFVVLLQRLGAKTTKTFSERVTHVIFKEGSPQLLQRLRTHNKQVAQTGVGREIHCVNSRWVTDCDREGQRVDEVDEIYTVEMMDGPQSAKRRRKSMEPMSLMNIGGNVVRDPERKSSLGRSSLGRLKSASPPEIETPKAMSIADKENSGEDSPATPAYLAAPESLVMQTEAPKRVKKLEFGQERYPKNRRQTLWNGGV